MNLVNRGFIPPNVDLSAAFSRGAPPVTQAPVRLHQFQEQFAPTMPYVVSFLFVCFFSIVPREGSFKFANVPRTQCPPLVFVPHSISSRQAPFLSDIANIKLDVAHVVKTREQTILRQHQRKKELEDQARQKKLDEQLMQHTSSTTSHNTGGSQVFDMGPLGPGNQSSFSTASTGSKSTETKQQIDTIRGYNELLDQYSLHQFIIRRGKVLDMTPEFQSFQRTHVAEWGPITTVVKLLEQMLTKFSVPMAYIDGHSVIQLAERGKKERKRKWLCQQVRSFF